MDSITLAEINNVIERLEQGMRLQADLDIAYNGWCDIVKAEMYNKLSFKTVKPYQCKPILNKNKKCKPWWSQKLSEMWNSVHIAERSWLKCLNRAHKRELKHEYTMSRKAFDKEVQRCKRNFWQKNLKCYSI
jgi:hypothetical protein